MEKKQITLNFKYAQVGGSIIKETEKAYGFSFDHSYPHNVPRNMDGKTVWVPKSIIKNLEIDKFGDICGDLPPWFIISVR